METYEDENLRYKVNSPDIDAYIIVVLDTNMHIAMHLSKVDSTILNELTCRAYAVCSPFKKALFAL